MAKTRKLAGKFGIVLCGALLGCTTYGQPSVEVGVSVSLPTVEIRAESDFYEPLAPQGEWVVIGSYGRCWRPGHVARDWRPYSEGYWQRTDAGWYWVSDEPWAWATYHYGRWNFTDQYGWYWVPQIEWAPSWVSWHEGGGYIGWAPLYPSGVTVILPQAYVFVEERHFMEPVSRSTVVVNNTTIINKTVINNQGPETTVIEKASGRKIAAVPVQELRHKQEAAVASKQRAPAATGEKNVPTPVRSEAQPAGQKAAPTPESRQVQKPAAVTQETVTPAPKDSQAQSGKQKPVPAAPDIKAGARPEPVAPAPKNGNAQNETRKSVPPAAESKPAAKSEAIPPAIKEPAGQNAGQQPGKQQKAAQPPDKKTQQPATEQPAASDNNGANPADKNQKDKGKE